MTMSCSLTLCTLFALANVGSGLRALVRPEEELVFDSDREQRDFQHQHRQHHPSGENQALEEKIIQAQAARADLMNQLKDQEAQIAGLLEQTPANEFCQRKVEGKVKEKCTACCKRMKDRGAQALRRTKSECKCTCGQYADGDTGYSYVSKQRILFETCCTRLGLDTIHDDNRLSSKLWCGNWALLQHSGKKKHGHQKWDSKQLLQEEQLDPRLLPKK